MIRAGCETQLYESFARLQEHKLLMVGALCHCKRCCRRTMSVHYAMDREEGLFKGKL